jgi:hypothetical protein
MLGICHRVISAVTRAKVVLATTLARVRLARYLHTDEVWSVRKLVRTYPPPKLTAKVAARNGSATAGRPVLHTHARLFLLQRGPGTSFTFCIVALSLPVVLKAIRRGQAYSTIALGTRATVGTYDQSYILDVYIFQVLSPFRLPTVHDAQRVCQRTGDMFM